MFLAVISSVGKHSVVVIMLSCGNYVCITFLVPRYCTQSQWNNFYPGPGVFIDIVLYIHVLDELTFYIKGIAYPRVCRLTADNKDFVAMLNKRV